jgi:Arc/MetJ-type ribon-helix-helix transcriptional regulator
MKTLTVRLPEALWAEIEAESRGRKISRSDVARDRLRLSNGRSRRESASLDAIADLIGSVEDDLPTDLSARKKYYLKVTRFGQSRPR